VINWLYVIGLSIMPPKFLRSQRGSRGQGLVEYALIIGIVAVAAIVILGAMSGKIQAVFTQITSTLPQAPPTATPGI
jgi:Flp pilus assembly pilin Flp